MSSVTALFASTLAAVCSAGGVTPGSYAHMYDFKPSAKTSADIQTDVQWLRLPDMSIKQHNAVFHSTQYFTEAGPAGYFGTQTYNDNGKRVMLAIFTMWDANETVHTAWEGKNCGRFGGEGVGSHCIIHVDLAIEKMTTLRFHEYKTNATHAVWQGLFGEQEIGKLVFPNYKGKVGYGHLSLSGATFIEYYLGGDCTKGNTVNVEIGTAGPFYNNRTIAPTVAQGQTHFSKGGAASCANVVGGIKGDSSKQGAPYLTYLNGPDYVPTHADTEDVWKKQ